MNTKGTRRDVDDYSLMEEGEYGKGPRGDWYCRPPGSQIGCLRSHKIEEHPDGTITVSPSILINWGQGQWHGYLVKGEWQPC